MQQTPRRRLESAESPGTCGDDETRVCVRHAVSRSGGGRRETAHWLCSLLERNTISCRTVGSLGTGQLTAGGRKTKRLGGGGVGWVMRICGLARPQGK